jgi:RNA polymerase sigma-70 factor (ECF subfamily)
VSSYESAIYSEALVSGPEPMTISISTPKFAQIYDQYFSFVWSMARYMGVEATALDDVVQDIFVIICERLHTLQHPEALRSWIYGIARRVVSTHHRTQRSALITTGTMRLEPELIHPELPTPQQLAEQSERAKLLWKLVAGLDEQKREVFVLAELEEMTAPEIAAVTNVPLNTVYSRLRAARQELEEALQRHIARTQRKGSHASAEPRSL